MIVSFGVLFVLTLTARIAFGAYLDKVEFFRYLLTPFTVLAVIFGGVLAIVTVIRIIKEIRK